MLAAAAQRPRRRSLLLRQLPLVLGLVSTLALPAQDSFLLLLLRTPLWPFLVLAIQAEGQAEGQGCRRCRRRRREACLAALAVLLVDHQRLLFHRRLLCRRHEGRTGCPRTLLLLRALACQSPLGLAPEASACWLAGLGQGQEAVGAALPPRDG